MHADAPSFALFRIVLVVDSELHPRLRRSEAVTLEGDSHSGVGMIHHGKRGGFQAAAIELRADLSGDDLRGLARGSRDAKQSGKAMFLMRS